MTITARLSDWYWNLNRRRKFIARSILWLVVISIPVYIFLMPLKAVPITTPIGEDSPRAVAASELFWEVFHDDAIERSQEVADSLTAAYAELDKPSDELTSLLAGVHLWRFFSRNRLEKTAMEMRPDLAAAQDYGRRVAVLDAGVTKSTAPSIVALTDWLMFTLDGQPERVPGVHIDMLENSIVWPPFAGFMQGWMVAPMYLADNPYYPQSMIGYRFMLDTCAGFKLPKALHFTKITHTLYGFKSLLSPVCYNNPVAPHSIEGTLMAVADTYLKGGDMEEARLWYNNVKTSPTYATWAYQDVLEQRLADLPAIRAKFISDNGKLDVTEPAMTMQSQIGCGMCHTR